MSMRNIAALACVAAIVAGCASGGGGRDSQRNEPVRALLSADVMLFVSFDANADLVLSRAELEAGLEREFARADVSGDGQLQPIEFQNWANTALGGGHIGPFRLDFDRNVDNIITRDEFNGELRARFDDYDTDENGMVARSDFVRLVGQARPPSDRRPAVRNPEPPPQR